MDRTHGSKPRSGGVASSSITNIDRRERLKQLAMETGDVSKDPYIMKNHLGTFECKLCLTVHNTEGNYLAHTQGRKHQTNLAKRAAREARTGNTQQRDRSARKVLPRNTVKIGRPGYRVTKQLDPISKSKSLLFQIDIPEIEAGSKPFHRIMSTFEQRQEPVDKRFQYVLFAAEPYETIGFKVPNMEIDKSEGKFHADWNADSKLYTLLLSFKNFKDGQNAL